MPASKRASFDAIVLEADQILAKPLQLIEVEAARRALAVIKGKLGSAALISLLKEEIEETDRLWETWTAESKGEWTVARVTLDVRGLTVDDWLRWIRTNLDDERMHFAVHPEHYAWTAASRVDSGYARGDYVIVELVGRFIFRIYVEIAEWDGVEAYFDPAFPRRMFVKGYTRGGVLVLKSIAQYKETKTGFIFKYDGMHPAKIPAPTSSTQEQVVLEYINYMKSAYMAQSAQQA